LALGWRYGKMSAPYRKEVFIMALVQFRRLPIIFVFLLFTVIPASLLDAQTSPFEKGSWSVSLGAGSGHPDIYKLSPQVKYVLPTRSRIRPYVGTFYRHIFIDHYDDLDSIGVRGGVYFMPDKQWFIGVGYPEITFSFSF